MKPETYLKELFKEVKETDMTVEEFKERIDKLEKEKDKDDYFKNIKEYDNVYDTPEEAMANFIYELADDYNHGEYSDEIVKDLTCYPEQYYDCGHGPEEIYYMSDDFNRSVPTLTDYALRDYDLNELDEDEIEKILYDYLEENGTWYKFVPYHERIISYDVKDIITENGCIEYEESDFVQWHVEATVKAAVQEYYERLRESRESEEESNGIDR